MKQDAPVLGFDYGSKRIGVAVGERITASARPLTVIANGAQGPDWNRILALVREWHPSDLIVGLPLTLEGGEQPASVAARDFANALRKRYGIAVHTQDERMSSREADARFAEARRAGARRARDAALLDAMAAQVILESWLNRPDSS